MWNQFEVQNFRTFLCNQVLFRVLLECSAWSHGKAESHSHDFQVSDDSHNSQRTSADARRGNSLRQRIGHVLDCANPREHASSIVARKAWRGSRIFICVDQWSKTMSHQKWCFGYNVIRRTTDQSWSQVYRRLLHRQAHLAQHLRHHYHRKVQAQHLFQHHLNVRVQMSKHGATRRSTQPETLTQIQMEDYEQVWGDPSFSEIPKKAARIQESSEGVPDSRDSHASSLHEPSLEPLRQMVSGKNSVHTHFPKDRSCEIWQRTNFTKGSMKETHRWSHTSCRKCSWLVNSRSQNSQWRMWLSKQSPRCSCGARLSYSMDSILSVQNKNFAGNWMKLAKVLRADQKSQTSFTLTIPWNLAKLVKNYLGIS